MNETRQSLLLRAQTGDENAWNLLSAHLESIFFEFSDCSYFQFKKFPKSTSQGFCTYPWADCIRLRRPIIHFFCLCDQLFLTSYVFVAQNHLVKWEPLANLSRTPYSLGGTTASCLEITATDSLPKFAENTNEMCGK